MGVKFLTVACLSVEAAAGTRAVLPSKGHIVETFSAASLVDSARVWQLLHRKQRASNKWCEMIGKVILCRAAAGL